MTLFFTHVEQIHKHMAVQKFAYVRTVLEHSRTLLEHVLNLYWNMYWTWRTPINTISIFPCSISVLRRGHFSWNPGLHNEQTRPWQLSFGMLAFCSFAMLSAEKIWVYRRLSIDPSFPRVWFLSFTKRESGWQPAQLDSKARFPRSTGGCLPFRISTRSIVSDGANRCKSHVNLSSMSCLACTIAHPSGCPWLPFFSSATHPVAMEPASNPWRPEPYDRHDRQSMGQAWASTGKTYQKQL